MYFNLVISCKAYPESNVKRVGGRGRRRAREREERDY